MVRGGFFGVTGRIELERIVVGEVSPRDYARLLREIRETVGRSGQLNETLDRLLSWDSRGDSRGWTERVQVTVILKSGGTRIRIVEYPGNDERFLGMLSFVLGGLAAVVAGAAAHALGGSGVVALLGGAAVWGGGYSALRGLNRRKVRRHFRTLSQLLDRLSGYVVSSVSRALQP